MIRAVHGAKRIKTSNPSLNPRQCLFSAEVGLVNENDISEGYLFLRLYAFKEVGFNVDRVHHSHKAIQPCEISNFLRYKKSRCHWRRISQSSGFYKDGIQTSRSFSELGYSFNQVAAYSATQATIIELY